MSEGFDVIVNQRTHLAVDRGTGRCLGGLGSNFYRSYVFPLYTPGGLTVVREFPFDHPFHNGVFVAQHPVLVGGREGNFWAAPPLRGKDDPLGAHMGRAESPAGPGAAPHARGVKFTLESVWLDENDQPLIDEIRTVDLWSAEDATVCDVTSEKVARYGPAEYPQTKFGSIGIRVESRLLPAVGGAILADGGRRGTAEVVHEQDSDFVAYEGLQPRQAGPGGPDQPGGAGRFGVCMSILDPGVRGPWFIRDYGMALYNPTWRGPLTTGPGESWRIRLRVVAYDGALTEQRARRWREAPGTERP